MCEDSTQVSHCVYLANTGLSIWWVDDCFTNRTDDGGYLPIEAITSNAVDPIIHGNSGDIYEMLLRLTREEGLSFHLCSFEYARTHWETLNSVNHIALIDIGYEGQQEGATYGINFLQEMSSSMPLLASVAFLTIDAKRVTDWIISTGNWLPRMPFPIQKSRAALLEVMERPPEQEVKALISYFKRQQPVSASEWRIETWQALRRATQRICDELGQADIGHGFWAHHLPHGGQVWTDDSYHNLIDLWTRHLRDQLKMISPAVAAFPEHCWKRSSSSLEREQIPGWDMPPIRALAQFDKYGCDLTAVLNIVGDELRRRPGINLNIFFHPRIQLEHDYLWFNACALARGLSILANSFSDEVLKAQHSSQHHESLPNLQYKGHVFWQITESLEEVSLGLSIKVHQTFVGWAGPGKKESPCLVTQLFPFPELRAARGSVRKAYDLLCRTGASIEIHVDGSLMVQIPARATNDGFWEVNSSCP